MFKKLNMILCMNEIYHKRNVNFVSGKVVSTSYLHAKDCSSLTNFTL